METEVQLVIKIGEYEDGDPMWVSICGVARFPDSSGETPEQLLAGFGCPGDEATAEMILGGTVIGAVDLDGPEIAARDQDAAAIGEAMTNYVKTREKYEGATTSKQYLEATVIQVREDAVFVRDIYNEVRAIDPFRFPDLEVEQVIDLAQYPSIPTNQLGSMLGGS